MEIFGAIVAIMFFAPAIFLVVHHDIVLLRQERWHQHEDQVSQA